MLAQSKTYEHAVMYLMGIEAYQIPLPHQQWIVGNVVNVADVDGKIHVHLESAVIKTPVGEISIGNAWVEVPDWSAHEKQW